MTIEMKPLSPTGYNLVSIDNIISDAYGRIAKRVEDSVLTTQHKNFDSLSDGIVCFGGDCDCNIPRRSAAALPTPEEVFKKEMKTKFSIKCAVFGHDWDVSRIYVVPVSFYSVLKAIVAVVVALLSCGLLLRKADRARFLTPHRRDAVCKNCSKCVFDASDESDKLQTKRDEEASAAQLRLTRHDKLRDLRRSL